jgi:hypothetical protein
MSKSGRMAEFSKFIKTLLLGSALGAGGVLALLLFGPQWFRELFVSSQPQQTSSTVANPSLSNSPIAVSPSPTASSTTQSPSSTTQSSQQVAFEDIKGVFGEKEITQLGQLGVFDTTTGNFNPQQPISRAEFARWLVRANNAIWFEQPDKMIREAEGGQATFADVPITHSDFRYIQGLANTGFIAGFDEKTYRPDESLTREQLIAIKVGVDMGGIPTDLPTDLSRAPSSFPDWTDKVQISKEFINSLMAEYESSNREIRNVERTFGALKIFKPQTPVTRAEAAVCISAIGDHTISGHRFDNHFRTTEQALQIRSGQKTSTP